MIRALFCATAHPQLAACARRILVRLALEHRTAEAIAEHTGTTDRSVRRAYAAHGLTVSGAAATPKRVHVRRSNHSYADECHCTRCAAQRRHWQASRAA
jgi:hypothetical protein